MTKKTKWLFFGTLCRRCRVMKVSQTSGFSIFCQWRPPTSWIYKISQFWRSARSRWQYASPYQVWQWSLKPFVEYVDLAIFQNGGGFRLVFLIFRNYNDRQGQEAQTAPVYKISCRSVKRMLKLLRYGNYSIFLDGDRRRLEFSKFQNCNGRKVQEGQTASLCQISCRSVKLLRRYDISFLLSRWRPPHLGFSNFGNFNSRNAQEGHANCITMPNFVEADQIAP